MFSPLFKVYVRGKSEGIKRPYKEDNPFAAMMQPAEPTAEEEAPELVPVPQPTANVTASKVREIPSSPAAEEEELEVDEPEPVAAASNAEESTDDLGPVPPLVEDKPAKPSTNDFFETSEVSPNTKAVKAAAVAIPPSNPASPQAPALPRRRRIAAPA